MKCSNDLSLRLRASRRVAAAAAAGLMAGSIACPAGSASAGPAMVPVVLPWDDGAPGPTDLRPVLGQSGAAILPVRSRNGQLVAGNRRLRLFGVNLTSGAGFPERGTAARVAARLAMFGINAVRFHFLDAVWGEPQMIDYGSGDSLRWRPEVLERFDYFVAMLREQGVYVNLNLLVGRRFGVGDGVDPAIERLDWKAAHAVGFFARDRSTPCASRRRPTARARSSPT